VDKAEFRRRLDRAVDVSRRLAERVLGFPVPEQVRFHFGELSRYETGKPPPAGKVKILGGRILELGQTRDLDASTMGRYLQVDEKVPVWINFHAAGSEGRTYLIEVITSESVTADESLFYHRHEGYPPFHVLGPAAADFHLYRKPGP